MSLPLSDAVAPRDRPDPPATDVVTASRPRPSPRFVPGLGLDEREWQPVLHALGTGAAVALLPSLGRPARRGSDLRTQAQAERLLGHEALSGTGDLVLVGHSASCSVVVEAARRSDRVVGLVLVGPVDPHAGSWPRLLSDWLRTAAHELHPQARRLVPQYLHTGLPSILHGMDDVRRYPIDRSLARLDLPVTVVRGDQDRIADRAWCAHLAAVGRAPLVDVAGGAHMIVLTHPDQVAAAVVGVVERTGHA